MNSGPLHEYDEAVLRMIAAGNRKTDATGLFRAKSDLEEEFGKDSHRLGIAIDTLKNRGYIKDIRPILAAFGDTSIDYEAYQITALGGNYLARAVQGSSTSYTIGGPANIAHNSPGAIQSLDLSGFDDDLKQKVEELQQAIEKKDSMALKKTFGYIADKSVDVAIAVLTQGMLR